MKRRNFVAVMYLAAVASTKAFAAKTKELSKGEAKKSIHELGDGHRDVIYLTRGSVVQLPKNPTPVESLLIFDIVKYRFGKSPIILPNGHKISSEKKDQITVSKEVRLNKTTIFYLQYTGPDIGWVVLS
jgi:hypothetical protein